ncbi:MAG: hypothetical protein JSR39_06925 [Verrucomicrobia bacterium]|nr:hypothetical protein [Verrucomicrobiota bacterium]
MYKLLLIIFSLFPLLCAWGSSSQEKDQPQPISQNSRPAQQDWDIFADLLYWHAGEVGMIPNSTISTKLDPGLVSKLKLNNLDFDWNFGFRAGGRYSNIGNNQWGISLSYTRYRTEAKNRGSYNGFVGIPTGFPLTEAITDADFFNLFWLFAAQSYHARWTLNYNIFDFKLDHLFAASETISLRPFLGLRGGWIYQDIHIRSIYHDVTSHNTPFLAKEKLTNHFWGIGPSCGLDTKWFLGKAGRHFFYLFGDLSGAFLWSTWNNSDHLTIGSTIAGTLRSKQRQAGSLMFQNLLGFEWSVKLNQRGAMLSLRLGYESQFWFDNLQIFNAYNGRQHNALTLQGGTFDLLFSF